MFITFHQVLPVSSLDPAAECDQQGGAGDPSAGDGAGGEDGGD